MPYITSANAAELSRKGKIARASNKLIKAEALMSNDNSLSTVYVQRRLARIRKLVDLLNQRIDDELEKPDCDGQRLNWLSAALERIAEQERILAGRPLPGSLRPERQAKVARATITLTPEPQPFTQPVVVSPLPANHSIASNSNDNTSH